MQALVLAVGDAVQALEDAFWPTLRMWMSLDECTGAQLDTVGATMNEAREGLDDTTYRRFLGAKQLVVASSGELARLHTIAERLSGTSSHAYTVGSEGRCVAIELGFAPLEWRPATAVLRRIYRLLDEAADAGVLLRPFITFIAGETFGWSDDAEALDWEGSWGEAL